MRITFNPTIMRTAPVRAISAVRRKPATEDADSVDETAEAGRPVTTNLSSEGRTIASSAKGRGGAGENKGALWNVMVNLAKL